MLIYLQMLLSKLNRDQEGQDLTEYGLLVALIAIAVVAAVVIFGGNISSFFSRLASTIQGW
jgi:pilus assembly protein Flp/PilA